MDARKVLAEGKVRALRTPETLISGGLHSYKDAAKREYFGWYGMKNHVVSPSIAGHGGGLNNVVERLHGTIRERDKVMRGFDNQNGASATMNGLKTYYNYIRPHMALDGKTPAEAAKIDLDLTGNKWLELIQQSARMSPNNRVWRSRTNHHTKRQ